MEKLYQSRFTIGSLALVAGIVGLTIGVIIAHYAGFPEFELVDGELIKVEVDYFGWIPRGWLSVTFGQLVAFGGSQLGLVGLALLVWSYKPMTWPRAAFLALISWTEFALIFGVFPSEWLNLSQGPLEWTNQREFINFPPILFLGNEVGLSLGALKDLIQVGMYQTFLVIAIIFIYKIQELAKEPDPNEVKFSEYGRELKKAGDSGKV